MNPRECLRDLLASERPLVMPDAYDALSARLIEEAGFKAVQCSGFSMALAGRCAPEAALTLERNLEITAAIVQAVRVPVMADGEDGYGSPEGVFATVQAFCSVGVAGINIEDQVLPPTRPKQVVDRDLMADKIHAAREAARYSDMPDLVINARTDALIGEDPLERMRGLHEAIERGNLYLDAGADLVFVAGVSTPAEARRASVEIEGPVSLTAGMPPNPRALSIDFLRSCGVDRVSLPTVALFSAIPAIQRSLALVRANEDFAEVEDQLCSMQDVGALLAR